MATSDDPRTRIGVLALRVLAAVLALLATTLPGAAAAADAAEPPNGFLYEPPDRRPPGTQEHRVKTPAGWLLERVAEHLRELGMRVEQTDRGERRLLVALYAGDPREFVDCGVVRMVAGSGETPRVLQQYSANRPETRTHRVLRGRRIGLLREMRLDARVVVGIAPEKDDAGSRIKSEAVYVLTKAVSRVYEGGEAGPVLDREVVSFGSDGTGRFAKGTSCVATGRLEDLPALPFRNNPPR
jgi:hypothetical protein